jgi:hypothetical protein
LEVNWGALERRIFLMKEKGGSEARSGEGERLAERGTKMRRGVR